MLDAMFEHVTSVHDSGGVHVSFTYEDQAVTVGSDGQITVESDRDG